MKGTQIIADTVKKDIGIIIYYEANVHLIDLCISEFPSEIFLLLIAQIFWRSWISWIPFCSKFDRKNLRIFWKSIIATCVFALIIRNPNLEAMAGQLSKVILNPKYILLLCKRWKYICFVESTSKCTFSEIRLPHFVQIFFEFKRRPV